MRAYKATIRNEANNVDTGSVWLTFLVFAKDFVGATMEADRAAEELRTQLKKAGAPLESWNTLSVDSVECQCEIIGRIGVLPGVDGDSPMPENSIEDWARKVAEKTKKDMSA